MGCPKTNELSFLRMSLDPFSAVQESYKLTFRTAQLHLT